MINVTDWKMEYCFFVTAAKGLEPLLRDELDSHAIPDCREAKSGVTFKGSLEQGYRVCLWSRLANRVLLELDSFGCGSPEDLYQGVRRTDWLLHLAPDSSFAVNFSGTAPAIRNSHFAALKVKDAIVDQVRERCGLRPSVSVERPDLRVYVRLNRNVAVLYLDLSGESLHKRAYRSHGGKAPLKENLAAAILIKAGWPEISARGSSFVDPMCGSGTLLIEAAMIAGDVAPGLQREYFGFLGWKGHDAKIWEGLLDEALRRKHNSGSKIPPILGYDIDRGAIKTASENIRNAGFDNVIRVERRSANEIFPPRTSPDPGLIAVNPPYGERIEVETGIDALYSDFGQTLKSRFIGWRVAMLIEDAELGFRIGIRSRRPLSLYNGPIECNLLIFDVDPDRFFIPKKLTSGSINRTAEIDWLLIRAKSLANSSSPRAEMFANRLRKNLRNLGKWAAREGISCYRLYDADIPEYALAVDLYRGAELWVHAQEYQAPRSIDPELAEARLLDALSVIPDVLEISWEQIFFKVRRRQKGISQYNRREVPAAFHEVQEAGLRFEVNFDSYLDTGLFLDHRITRALVRQNAKGHRFLNLFAYTGSATVYAAAGGAKSTISVDLSKTYLGRAERNLALNGLDSTEHQFIQEDVLDWIERACKKGELAKQFDLIFLDPPTFSNSKGMDRVFDVQRDHVTLLERTSRLLAPDGLLIFSTNARKFRLEKDRLSGLNIADISRKTLPRDFERNPKIHQCFEMRLA